MGYLINGKTLKLNSHELDGRNLKGQATTPKTNGGIALREKSRDGEAHAGAISRIGVKSA